jgi:hypothetical protein
MQLYLQVLAAICKYPFPRLFPDSLYESSAVEAALRLRLTFPWLRRLFRQILGRLGYGVVQSNEMVGGRGESNHLPLLQSGQTGLKPESRPAPFRRRDLSSTSARENNMSGVVPLQKGVRFVALPNLSDPEPGWISSLHPQVKPIRRFMKIPFGEIRPSIM